MKVLVFTSLYPNNIQPHNGVFVKERMSTFAKVKDCEVKVVAPVPYYPPVRIGSRWRYSHVVKYEVRDGLEVFHPRYVMTPKVGMLFYGILMFLSVLGTVRRIRREFDFDLIDAHFVYPDGFAAVLLGKVFCRPVVVSARGSDVNLYGGFPLIRVLLRCTLNKADKVIAVCQALKDAMVRLGVRGDKIEVIPNGVDATKFVPLARKGVRDKLGLSERRIVLSVGGLVPRKGFDILVKAIKILAEAGRRDVQLIIAGDGPSRKELEKLVAALGLQQCVRMIGDIPHEELCLWYNAADLFCLASSREGWPNVVMEALACGTPVVATAVWGTPDIICSEDLGTLTVRDEVAMAKAIEKALTREWVRESIVRYARSRSWERTADSVFQIFEALLSAKSQDRPIAGERCSFLH